MVRSHTPPPVPISEQSSPAYHSSIGDSVTTLSDSWIPVPDPASPAHSLSLSSASDHDTLSTLGSGSGSEHGDGDDDTAGFLTDSSDDHDHDHEHDHAIDLLDGEEYTDAESPATDLRASNSTLGAPSIHSSLIYPYADGGSFSSSTTVPSSDSTTPNASVGALPPSGQVPRVQRMSAHRLEQMANKATDKEKGETGTQAGLGLRGSMWSPGLEVEQMISWAGSDDYPRLPDQKPDISLGKDATKISRQQEDKQVQTTSVARDIRQEVKNDRLRRALASAKAAGLRAGNQRWSLKMSLFTLASLLGMILATARYSTTSAFNFSKSSSAPEPAPVPIPAPPVRAFSILDYLSAPSLVASGLFDSAPSSVLPDARLIKNALSLSTKAVPLAPAEIKSTKRSTQHQSKERIPKGKSESPESTSHSLSVRSADVGLTTLFDGSAAWQKTIRGIVRPSSATAQPVKSTIKKDCVCDCGYGDMIISDLKTAWTRALSGFSQKDVIDFIRTQVLETVRREIREAIALAAHVLSMSKNATLATSRQVRKAADQTAKHASTVYDSMRTYGKSVNVTATTQRAYNAAHAARSGLGVVSSQAAMTSQKGKEAIYKARAGLDYLVAEAKRMRGEAQPDKEPEVPVARKGMSVRERFRAHRTKGEGKGKGARSNKPGRKASDKVKVKAETKKAKNGQIDAKAKLGKSSESTLKEKFMSAFHHAAMPFVI